MSADRNGSRAGHPPYPGTAGPGIRGEAARAGWLAAHEGQYDEWSFEEPAKLPYLQDLDHRRKQAMAEQRAADEAAQLTVAPENQTQRSRENVAGEHAQVRLDQLRRRRWLARWRERVTLAGLDALAGARGPVPHRDWADDEDFEEDAAPPPDDPETDQHSDRESGEPAAPAGPPEGRRSTIGWMGPAGGHLAPPLPRIVKMIIVLALCAVEVPIYLEIFRFFHARSEVLLWAFTLPVAFGMVAAPHLSGMWWRKRHALPYERIFSFLVPAVLVCWSVAAVLLGYLRMKALLVTQLDPETGTEIGGAQALHINPWTVAAIFSLVLLLSGLIAFMLGLAEDHPGVAAYRAAAETREAAEEEYLEAVRAHAGTQHSVVVDDDTRLASLRARSAETLQAMNEEYEAAKAAYLDAVTLGIAKPSVTEAAGTSLPPIPVPPVPGRPR